MPRKNKKQNKNSKNGSNVRGKSRTQRQTRRRGARGFVSASNRSTGARIGSRVGAFLGHAAQGVIGRLFGAGEYKEALAHTIGAAPDDIVEGDSPAVNTLVEPLSTQHVAMMHCDEEGTCRVTRREFVTFVEIGQQFLTSRLTINPGIDKVFPWSAGIAENWQQWSVQGLAFEFVPTSGFAVSNTNAALGQVIMSFYYEVTDLANAPIGDPVRQLNMNGAVSCSPAAPGVCYLECDPSMNNQSTYYTQNENSVPSGPYSSQNYVPAAFLITTGGAQNASPFQAGQLWVTYDIVYKQPIPALAPSPTLIVKHPRYRKFYDVWVLWKVLRDTTGPYTADQWVAVDAERSRLLAILQSGECQAELRVIRALCAESRIIRDDNNRERQRVLTHIEQTPLWQEINEGNAAVRTAEDVREAAQCGEDALLLPKSPPYK